jgi:hypothetical protein
MPRLRELSLLLLLLSILTACNLNAPPPELELDASPALRLSDTPTQSVSRTPSPMVLPSPSATRPQVVDVPILIASPLPTEPDAMPTVLVTPTETPGPYVHIVQSGETLGYIMQLQPWGYPAFDEDVINAILQANGIASPDSISVGQELLIPRRTPTPIPEGLELTQAAAAERGETIIGDQAFVQGQEFGEHVVEEGETLVGIMETYNTTLEVLSQQNPNLNWLGCDFTNPSGGERCNPTIFLGQPIRVPLPTRTPVPTNTPSGNETATPTPTYPPARTFFPPNGVIASGMVELRWVSVGVLKADEAYLVEVVNRTTNETVAYATTDTAYTLPTSLIPDDGTEHTIEWRVTVGRRGTDGTYQPIGGQAAFRTFIWRSR